MHKFPFLFSNKLIAWYLENKRDMPWRSIRDPYRIWLSEIILQQTRVSQGTPYYNDFIQTFPNIYSLANAPEEKVLKLWQGLGYYSRARNMHDTAQYIVQNLNGKFPNTYKDLIKLKGIGDYTASAVASICFDEPTAVVDGNVYRVLSRIFGIETPINSTKGRIEFKELAQNVLDPSHPGTFNQAIMEFGARYCIPQNPDCDLCIFNDQCKAFQEGKVLQLPVKIKLNPVKKRYFNYLVILSGNNRTIIQQRTNNGIWHKMYEFPLIETENDMTLSELKKMTEYQDISVKLNINSISLYNDKPVVHKLSHQYLYTRFWIVEAFEGKDNTIPISEINDYPIPVLIKNFVSEYFENYE